MMMETINISLPAKLAYQLDEVVAEEGYASRSELFRNLLHFYLQMAKIDMFFLPFEKQPLNKVKKQLTNSGLYNQKFINSVIRGLKRSSLYANQRT